MADEYEELLKGTENQEAATSEKTTAESTADATAQPKALITAEDAEKYGLSKGLIGKPQSIMFEEYQNIRKVESKNAQSIAALTKQVGEFSEALSKKEVAQVVKEVEEELPDLDKFIDDNGYISDKAGYNAAFKKREELRESRLKKEFKTMLEEKEKEREGKEGLRDKSLKQIQTERNNQKFYENLSDGLGSIYSEDDLTPDLINKVITDYGNFLDEQDKEDQANYHEIYDGKPEKLAKAAIMFHKANSHSKPTDDEKTKELAKKAHEKEIKKLKETNKTFTGASSSARNISPKSGDNDYDELIAEAAAEIRS